MKINNNNIRAAKRLDRGANGVSYRDFAKIPEYDRDIANRTQEKSEIVANERESDYTGASQ